MKRGTLIWWILTAVGIAITSAVILVELAPPRDIPSFVRDPLSDFVNPGVTVWWFALGGPFRTGPSSPSGIAFAAVFNAASWLLAFRLIAGLHRALRWIIKAARRAG
jgi:hypothetical protein